jgi:hypothetical protein
MMERPSGDTGGGEQTEYVFDITSQRVSLSLSDIFKHWRADSSVLFEPLGRKKSTISM